LCTADPRLLHFPYTPLFRSVLGRADVCLEHQTECARFGQIFPATIRTLFDAFLVDKLISAQSRFARSTINHRVAERVFVAARFRSEEHTSELQSREHLECSL